MAKQKLPISGYDYVMPKPDAETIRKSIVYKLIFILGVDPKEATSHQWLNAAMLAARDLIAEDFLKTRRAHIDNSKRMVYYLSMEFLLGRAFVNALINEGVYAEFEEAFKQLGKEFADVCEQEEDPGLGNGGLGRLAACFLDSLATLRIPAMGYGIRYQYGMFKQEIVDGQQVEKPDLWLDQDLAWQFARPNKQYSVRFGGQVLNLGNKKNGSRAKKSQLGHTMKLFRAMAANVPTHCACGLRTQATCSTLPTSTEATMPLPFAHKTATKTSRASSIRTTLPIPAANCA